jgi:hypothetical protein
MMTLDAVPFHRSADLGQLLDNIDPDRVQSSDPASLAALMTDKNSHVFVATTAASSTWRVQIVCLVERYDRVAPQHEERGYHCGQLIRNMTVL